MPADVMGVLARAPRPVGLLGAVTKVQRPIRLEDATRHAAFGGLPAGHPPVGAFLGVPIVRGDKNVASLFVARAPGQVPFTDEDERAADLMARYVGVAISNARLYGQARAASRVRDDLLATVSHDLRNPINAIRLTTQLLRRRLGDEAAGTFTQRIDRAVDRVTRLIDDLLDAAKLEEGALRVTLHPDDGVALIESTAEMFRVIAAEKGIELATSCPTTSAPVACERHLILRVLGNLVGNAIKFSERGSAILLTCELQPEHVKFCVVDHGPGIAADYVSHAFERYWQQGAGDRRGSGLGLYIAKGIVEAHGGAIWIESVLGQGTTVCLVLPRVAER
jgi:signal transduction histidine kinase